MRTVFNQGNAVGVCYFSKFGQVFSHVLTRVFFTQDDAPQERAIRAGLLHFTDAFKGV